jgi:hypothetical protein
MLPPAQQRWFEAWMAHQQLMAQQNQQQMQEMQSWNRTPPGQAAPNPLLGRMAVPALAQGAPQSALMMYLMGQQANGAQQAPDVGQPVQQGGVY